MQARMGLDAGVQQQGTCHTRVESLMELACCLRPCGFLPICGCTLQEEQRAERQAAKAALQQLSVRDKTTFASRQQALFADDTIRTAFHEALKASKKVRIMPGVCGCMMFVLACSSREEGNFTTAAGSVRQNKAAATQHDAFLACMAANNSVCAAQVMPAIQQSPPPCALLATASA